MKAYTLKEHEDSGELHLFEGDMNPRLLDSMGNGWRESRNDTSESLSLGYGSSIGALNGSVGHSDNMMQFSAGLSAWRVSQSQIALRGEGFSWGDLDFAGNRKFMKIEGTLF
jgi:hypothetical protein